MNLTLELQVACDSNNLPTAKQFQQWSEQALQAAELPQPAEVTIRIIDETESATLNLKFRGKPGPTNVLSFHYEPDDSRDCEHLIELGDLAICAPLVLTEAANQQIPIEAHWAHLTIHGMLHLLGFDHINDKDAEQMEQLETESLKKLGYANPYEPSNE